ncbi:hypothetical protein ACJ72_06075 [Emergomyces africanus]|uniref:Uncharacterized protein n=1 Tax=Emergomyces africanus TaxID=1955775 RepID=A0A1B7NS35_9EURO|nr:hypothetical protein ACJ72_06075 [Emergomyces africanus]
MKDILMLASNIASAVVEQLMGYSVESEEVIVYTSSLDQSKALLIEDREIFPAENSSITPPESVSASKVQEV